MSCTRQKESRWAIVAGGARRLDLRVDPNSRRRNHMVSLEEADRLTKLLDDVARPFNEAYRQRYEVPGGVSVSVVQEAR
ncbi:MAG: hypothetical protein Q8P41_31600 [Pseudomonadota bacterium]|nr:hypothetical protein [Pseudomonadota bacterium]